MIRAARRRLLTFFFRLLYKEFAFTYDSVSRLVSLGLWRDWQRAVLPYLDADEPGSVLELAHGTGALQVDLLRAGHATVALDLSRAMGRIAQKRLSRARLSSDLLRGDALALPFARGCFAAVVSTFPAPFILDQRCLAEINRVLARQGKAIIVYSASIERRGWRGAAIRFLYRVTGQSPGAAAGAALQRACHCVGLSPQTIEIECQNSLVQVILLRKQAADYPIFRKHESGNS